MSIRGDVYFFANDQIPTLADSGALAKLGGDTEQWVKDNNEQTMVQSVTYNDGIYGVPFTSNTWFMYYDKSKYTEDEVKSLDTMMAKDLGEGVYNFAFPMDNSWYIEAFYFGAGCSIFRSALRRRCSCMSRPCCHKKSSTHPTLHPKNRYSRSWLPDRNKMSLSSLLPV